MNNKLRIKIILAAFGIILSCSAMNFAQSPVSPKASVSPTPTPVKSKDPIAVFADLVISSKARESDELMERAKTLIEKKDFTAAIQILNDVIKTNPNNGDAYQLRGDAYRLRGYANVNLDDWKNSKNDYTQAINFGTKNAKVYENRSDLSWLSNTDQAIADILQANKLDPNNENIKSVIKEKASWYESLGLQESQSKKQPVNWQVVYTFYTYAITLEPTYSRYLQRGVTNHSLGNFGEQIDDLQIAVEMMPKDELGLNFLLREAVNDLSANDFENITNSRLKLYYEKQVKRVASGVKLATITDLKTRGSKPEICQVVNDFQTAFGEEKTAFHQLLFARLRNDTSTWVGLVTALETLKADETGIASNQKQLDGLNKFCQN